MDFCSKILTAGLIGFCPCSGSVLDCKKEELKCAKHDVIHKVRYYLKCMQKIFGKYVDLWIFVCFTYGLSYCLLLLWFHCTDHGWSCSWCLQ